MHALIVGERGVGKSTLIRRVLQELNRPLFGFETVKEDALADEINGSPVYIYDAGSKHVQKDDNLVGYCRYHHSTTDISGFDRYSARLLFPHPEECVIEMDEIGFMESKSAAFCSAIMTLLDGKNPAIAAVKDKDTPFLAAVRSHPNAHCFYITPENRDALFFEVLEFMKTQLGERAV